MPHTNSGIRIVTRKQLRGLGLSLYHAAAITKTLQYKERRGSTYLYSVNEVVTSIRQYLQRSRIKAETRIKLETVLAVLLNLIGNLIPATFGTSTQPELSHLARELMTAIAKTDSSLAALKIDAAGIKATYSVGSEKE